MPPLLELTHLPASFLDTVAAHGVAAAVDPTPIIVAVAVAA